MKRTLSIFSVTFFLLVGLILPVSAENLSVEPISIRSSDDLKNAITGGLVDQIWNIEEDINFQNDSKTRYTLPKGTTINGNGHTLRATGVMSNTVSSLFTAAGSLTVNDLNLIAPNKVHDDNVELIHYTPTLISFGGNGSLISFTNVAINLADGSHNQMVALYFNSKNTVATFTDVNLNEGRIYVQSSASGTLHLNNTNIYQRYVEYKDDIKDEFLVYQTETAKTNFVVTAEDSHVAYRIDYKHPTSNYKTIDNIEVLRGVTPTGLETEYLFDDSNKVKISVTKEVVEIEKGSVLPTDLYELFGFSTTFALDSVNVSRNVTGTVDTNTVAEYPLQFSAYWALDTASRNSAALKDVTIKVVEKETPVVVPPKPVVDPKLADVIDEEAIKVGTSEGAFDEEVTLNFALAELTDTQLDALQENANKLGSESGITVKQILVLSITPESLANGGKIQLNEGGSVTITLPVPTKFASTAKLVVYHVNSDGSLTALDTTVVDGVLTFTATEFSDFVIAEVAAAVPGELPPSGLDSKSIIGVAVVVAGLAMIAADLTKKRYFAKHR